MPKKSNSNNIVLTLATKAPTDREKMWAAMRQEKTFTQNIIAALADCRKSKVKDFLGCLIAGGFVEREKGKNLFNNTIYKLIRDTGVDAPRLRKDGRILPASGRTRMWNAMRILGTFTAIELAHTASLDIAPIAEKEALFYCRWLARGGYLRSEGNYFKFMPAMYSGAKAPQVLRTNVLLDSNSGEVVYVAKSRKGRDDE